MDERIFRDAMGKFATGITVVTIKYKDKIFGMTVNAFMSISLNPKLIAISIGENARMYEDLQQTKKFGVSILHANQQDLSILFAQHDAEDEDVDYIFQGDIPVIQGSLARLSCHVKEMVKAGDHMIFIAEVTELTVHQGEPILYADGEYRHILPKE